MLIFVITRLSENNHVLKVLEAYKATIFATNQYIQNEFKSTKVQGIRKQEEKL